MSRQIPIPLLKWRQGAGQRFINKTNWAMKPMLPDCLRFASLNPRLLINLFGGGSIAIFWALAVTGIKPAQANPPNQKARSLEQSQVAQPTDVGESREQESSSSASQTLTSVSVAPPKELARRSSDSLPLDDSAPAAQLPHTPSEKAELPAASSLSEKENQEPNGSGETANLNVSVAKQSPASSHLQNSSPLRQQTARPSETTAQTPTENPKDTESSLLASGNEQPIPVATEALPQSTTTKASAPSLEKSAVAVGTVANPITEVQAVGQPAADLLQKDTSVQQVSREIAAAPSLQPPVLAAVPSVTPGVPSNPSNTKLAQLPYLSQTLPPVPVPATPIPMGSDSSNTKLGQLPYFPQPPSPVPVQSTQVPVGFNSYNPMAGQSPYFSPNPVPIPVQAAQMPVGFNGYNPMAGQPPYFSPNPAPMPIQAMVLPVGFNGYNPMMGQSPYSPQTVILVPVQATQMPVGFNGYNPMMGQSPYFPQTAPVPLTPNPVGFNSYNPGMGQTPYLPQTAPVQLTPNPVGFNSYNPGMGQTPYLPQTAPVQLAPNPVGFNSYNPGMGQTPYLPQTPPPLPAPLTPNPVGFNSYNPGMGQPPYLPQTPPPLPAPLTPNPVGFNSYNPGMGQPPYLPQTPPPPPAVSPTLIPVSSSNYNLGMGQTPYLPQNSPPLPVPSTPNSGVPNNYNSTVGQSPYLPQTPPPLPYAPNLNLTPPAPTPTTGLGVTPSTQQPSLFRSTALTSPSVRLQGVYINQGDQSSARARVSALYPLNPRVQFGGTLDLTSDANSFADSPTQGLNINELYVATAPFADLPNFRLVAGQLDLTSYFDRNSFAKDAATHFFNPVFQTNPALSATGVSSRPGALVNWTITDNIEAKAAIFSSARTVNDFTLDGFAGEIGLRYGNGIIRGTFVSDRDAGSRDGFQEIFGVARSDGGTGLRTSDREEAYGVNGEYFFPQLNMGVFGRYGRYDNRELGLGGDTFSGGISFVDVFSPNDRLGLAYGRTLSNDKLRRERGDEVPDVLELFYDFRFLPNLRLGFTFQQRNDFSETYGGFRVKTELDVTPRGRLAP